jgi:RNA polymerase sigma-70 factor (ECF subfamily)
MNMAIKKNRTSPTSLPLAEKPSADLSSQFEAIFLEHWSQVYGLLLRLVGDHAEAEDLALDAFLRLYQRQGSKSASAKGEDNFNVGGWLHRVATNLGLNAIRGWKRRQRYELESGKVDLVENDPTSPAEIFATGEERQRVRIILSQMEPRQAQLLILRHSGLTYQEIAAALELSVASIGTLLGRAESEFARRYRAADHAGG